MKVISLSIVSYLLFVMLISIIVYEDVLYLIFMLCLYLVHVIKLFMLIFNKFLYIHEYVYYVHIYIYMCIGCSYRAVPVVWAGNYLGNLLSWQ